MNYRVLLLLIVFTTMPVFAGHIYYLTPKVVVIRNGKEIIANKGMQIYAEDRIKTYKSGFAILDFDGIVKVKVGKNTNVLVKKLLLKTKISSNAKTNLYLKSGKLAVEYLHGKISKNKKNKFIVKTKIASLGVRGTKFYIDYSSPTNLWMCVNQGLVEVKNKLNKYLVPEGQGVSISSKGEISAPEDVPWIKQVNWNFSLDKGEVKSDFVIPDYDFLRFDYD
ncbi:MAG: hypothetical protein HOJ35_03495 [Bdellovibrionales bacterium]|nr:hypothetical protein [Bdellovibrionales bacterium]